MITIDDIDKLSQRLQRESVREYLEWDPVKIALTAKIECASLVASQVKYLQRARKKLPSYYAAQCIIPSLAFEQSSSEECAAHKSYSGQLCIDLTCGLGVDSFYLSRGFEKVISLERDPALAHLARVNFALLGASNIEVVCSSAEDFLAENGHLRPDMIYADPDRRGTDGRKLVCMEDCSPNMVALMPQLEQMASRVVVKCSPLFDVDRAFEVFATKSFVCVEVVSLGGECKEVIVELGREVQAHKICATAIGLGSVEYDPVRERTFQSPTNRPYNYLIVPDVALQKARVAVDYFSACGAHISSDNGFAFTDSVAQGLLGRVFEIDHMEHYTPKKLKRQLREQAVSRLNILRRDFPQTSSAVVRELSVVEGGERSAAFTMVESEPMVIFLR